MDERICDLAVIGGGGGAAHEGHAGDRGATSTSSSMDEVFGADLTLAESRYLASFEWATRAEDVVWRRSRLRLRMTAEQIAHIDTTLDAIKRADEAAQAHGRT